MFVGVFFIHMSIKKSKNKAFTLLEMLIAVVILSIIVGISFQALRNSRTEADKVSAAGDAKSLNDAIRRVEIAGTPGQWSALSNIIHVQQDGDAAILWLVDNGYLRLQ